jgi:hypothetical protein
MRGPIKTRQNSDRARGTHELGTEEGLTCQNMEREKLRGGALTDWRRQSESLIRRRKESGRARGTHSLETAEGGISQNTEKGD